MRINIKEIKMCPVLYITKSITGECEGKIFHAVKKNDQWHCELTDPTMSTTELNAVEDWLSRYSQGIK